MLQKTTSLNILHQSKLDKMLAEEHAAYFKLSTELNLIKNKIIILP